MPVDETGEDMEKMSPREKELLMSLKGILFGVLG
jgi:hypothetical protein